MRAATIDELVSDAFEAAPGESDDNALFARRLAAWHRSAAARDEPLFARRLDRDALSMATLNERFGAVRRSAGVAAPAWLDDAVWIEAALQSSNRRLGGDARPVTAPVAFEHLLAPVVEQAGARLWSGLDARVIDRLRQSARADLHQSLLVQLSELCAPAIYERFAQARGAGATEGAASPAANPAGYDQFVTAMKAGGLRLLFEDKPVLLRLIAAVTRQWIDTSREFVLRLDADLALLRHDILRSTADGGVAKIEGGLSDPHNGGHAVLIVTFADGGRVAYKPKDLRLDVAWHALIERLNGANPPVALRAARAIARDGYGWTEFIAHAGCADASACARFFRRAGALLALFHVFATTDMHQENMIAAGDQPVPVDLETILQPSAEEHKAQEAEGRGLRCRHGHYRQLGDDGRAACPLTAARWTTRCSPWAA